MKHHLLALLRTRKPLFLLLLLLLALTLITQARAQEDDGPTAPTSTRRVHPIQRPGQAGATTTAPVSGWSYGTLGIGAVLAGVGLYAFVIRRYPQTPRPTHGNAIQVLGRQSLGGRHSIYTVRVGSRTLLVGTGTQGPPTLLTELDDWLDEPSPQESVKLTERIPATVRIEPLPRPITTAGGV